MTQCIFVLLLWVKCDNDDIEANAEDSGDDIFGKDDFKPGDMYTTNMTMATTRHLGISTLWKLMAPNYTKCICQTAP